MNPQFTNAFAHRFRIPEKSGLYPNDTLGDLRSRAPAPQGVRSNLEFVSLDYVDICEL